jgi:transcriptional regulator with XRE-family HTH domain
VRKKSGLSQKELAERLNTTREAIDYYERRAVNPSLAFIERAAESLEVSVAELVSRRLKTTKRSWTP